MILYITDRNIRVYNADNQISYNSDYIAEFRFDDEWSGKVKTARFIQDGEYFDIVLADDRCEIPPLKTGFVRVGVFTDSMTSTYADVYYKTSIKDGAGNPTEPPEDVYAQLTSLIESGMLKGEDGLTPYVGSNNNWWIGDIDTGILARGTDGEDGYTPVKGVDYFTEEEVQQIQNEVSGGAIGDFKAVVDEETATFNTNAENTLTGYNANAQEKINTYNANADSKFETYNTNAETKFSGYNTNAEAKLSEYNKNDLDKTTLYNTNADSKFTKYNTNAETKFSEYTNNADTKLAEYNQNDSDKTDLYNANAESKLGAYDSNAQAQLDLYNQNDSEKTETYNSNAQTKLDAYNENADNRLSEYNENADNRVAEFNAQTEQIQSQIDSKFEAYNTNAEAKLSEYNSNAESKVATYNQNDVAKTEAYNSNASEKLTTYDTNAEQHTTDYNRNAEVKLEAYNSNHTEKLTEYNTNAETKKAEFDSNAAALQTEVDRLREQIVEKANVDGYYEEMTVGDAEQLVATKFVEDNEPYMFRPTGGSSDVANRAYLDKIVGGTVVWNQQIKLDKVVNHNGITASFNNDRSITINGTATSDAYVLIDSRGSFKLNENSKYLYKGCPSGGSGISYFLGDGWNNMGRDYGRGTIFTATSGAFQPNITVRGGNTVSNLTFKPNLIDLTQMFGSTIADYIYSLEQSQAGAGVAWFKKLFPKDYYEYNAGELLSVEGLQSHDAVGFNQWDEALENGGLNAETGLPFDGDGWLRTKNFIPIFPGTAYYYKIPTRAEYSRLYFYDVDKNLVSYAGTSMMNETFTTPQNAHYMKFTLTKAAYGTTYNHDICINLSNPSRNGEYEPYEKHSYPLDNSLTLRGIPKLDASNNIYYDGDEYASDGKVKRKYGVVDLGTLNWVRSSSNRFYADINTLGKASGSYDKNTSIICSRYESKTLNQIFAQTEGISIHSLNGGSIWIYDTRFTEGADVKEGLNGVMCYYELATPTTETAEPFQHIQIVDDFGTEEFVSTGIVPVGHNTRYPANLRDKLQHLPDMAGMDGTYLIRQTGKQMSLVYMPAVFPETPTEDGTYTLKTVVTGGVATLQWVTE